MSGRAVVGYLLQHPEFSIHNAAQVEHIRVPHPIRDSISLMGWHMIRMRNHIHVLEENMSLLMKQAVANKSLLQRLLQLQTRLAAAGSLGDIPNCLHHWAHGLGLAGATVRLFPDCQHLGAPSKFTHLVLSRQAFEPIRIQHLGQAHHYLGPLNDPELLMVLPEAKAIGSVAMSMLDSDNTPGMMLFSSRSTQHHRSRQGTQLLQEIAQMLPGLLERRIERA